MSYTNFRKAALITIMAITAFSAASGKSAPIKRTMHYFPDGRDIVCINGEGRYTRALYGTHTRFRLETGDRPLFATYDKPDSWNFRFYAVTGSSRIQLDSTSWCKAAYQGGRRTYVLRDASWGNGEIRVYAMASFFEEGAIWRFEAEGFDTPVKLQMRKCRIASMRMNRDGDLGVDPRENFDPAPGEPDLTVMEWDGNGTSYCIYTHQGESVRIADASDGAPVFDKEEAARKELVSQVEFNTPDPFLNTIGSSLMAAADGMWDGQTWLHGCVGWRTPLAGWRGGYVGDVVGWGDRSVSHFNAYAHSMVTDVPPVLEHPQQNPMTLTASTMEFGTPMYSNGYICRTPNKNDTMHHYDMNLNYMDELLWHFCYDANPDYMREMWPYIKLHLEWEKRNFDPDGDHLYDAYCCIWASDALYYNAGAVTHSSAYNYRGNKLAARIAEIIGEDPAPYQAEADAILAAMDSRLWMDELGYWAEYQDYMGLKRLHKSAALWSVYTPIDCESCTPEQAYRATCYVDRSIPHIPVAYQYDKDVLKELGLKLPKPDKDAFTLSTTDWLPYVWSTNNVAHEEVANMAIAYLQAGRNDSGFKLLRSDIIDEMYLGACPGNFGQISYYDKARNESYRDFADNVGTTSRALVNGLFGIIPNALWGECFIKPAFPEDWQEASIRTPYLSYSFHREGKFDVYEVEQNFARPLEIVIRANAGGGAYLEVRGTSEAKQTIRVDRSKMPKAIRHAKLTTTANAVKSKKYVASMGLGEITGRVASHSDMVEMGSLFNSNADDIFRNEYLSPRPPYTTLSIPKSGIGDWCTPFDRHTVEDDGFRACISDGVFDTGLGLSFLSPAEGHNIAYTSLWDNYPDSIEIPLEGSARAAYLLLAGSTNNMQSRIENGRVTVTYTDGTSSVMPLENPINWYPVEQDYYLDGLAFHAAPVKPYRVLFSNGKVSRDVKVKFSAAAENGMNSTSLKMTDRGIPDGAATILRMPLEKGRTLAGLKLETLSNDVVIGIMAITLEK